MSAAQSAEKRSAERSVPAPVVEVAKSVDAGTAANPDVVHIQVLLDPTKRTSEVLQNLA